MRLVFQRITYREQYGPGKTIGYYLMGPYGGFAQQPSREYLIERQSDNSDNEPAENLPAPFGDGIKNLEDCSNLCHNKPPNLKLSDGKAAF
jgi:hypothetical protein